MPIIFNNTKTEALAMKIAIFGVIVALIIFLIGLGFCLYLLHNEEDIDM